MKAMQAYAQAISLLGERNIRSLVNHPASADQISDLEQRLGVLLPPSYKKHLMRFGVFVAEGIMIYGIGPGGVGAESAPSTLFSTLGRRSELGISNTMVEIMASGYGSFFVFDCKEVDGHGECPVFEVSADGFRNSITKVSDSFGEFFLQEIKSII